MHHRTRARSAGAHRVARQGQRRHAGAGRRWRVLPVLLAGAVAAACTPDIAVDPVPAVAEFDPSATPPRAPQPTLAVINPVTGRIDLGLAGIAVPPDCADPAVTARAACEFNQYLQSLDGFPTTFPATAPLSEAPDPATVVPTNIAVVEARAGVPIAGVTVGYEPVARVLSVKPVSSWPVGAFVWIGVRGYASGIRAADGRQVVASPVFHLLRQEQSLLCGATSLTDIPTTCPFYALLAQQRPPAEVPLALFQLEVLRRTIAERGGWDLMAAVGGIPRYELVTLWGFPIHSGSVIELDPPADKVPVRLAPNQVALAVNGLVDPATVVAFAPGMTGGTVYLMNLGALAQGDLAAGFPPITAGYANGQIGITTAAPLVPGALYGIAVTKGVRNPAGAPLVPPPVSVLLAAQGPLVDAAGRSTVPVVDDAQAAALELGRQQLAVLLDNMTFRTTTGLSRENLAYLFATPLEGP